MMLTRKSGLKSGVHVAQNNHDRRSRGEHAETAEDVGQIPAHADNGSGDYAIAFSTNQSVRRTMAPGSYGEPPMRLTTEELGNEAVSQLFGPTIDATIEAVYNSLLRARTETGAFASVDALPLEETLSILRRFNATQR